MPSLPALPLISISCLNTETLMAERALSAQPLTTPPRAVATCLGLTLGTSVCCYSDYPLKSTNAGPMASYTAYAGP